MGRFRVHLHEKNVMKNRSFCSWHWWKVPLNWQWAAELPEDTKICMRRMRTSCSSSLFCPTACLTWEFMGVPFRLRPKKSYSLLQQFHQAHYLELHTHTLTSVLSADILEAMWCPHPHDREMFFQVGDNVIGCCDIESGSCKVLRNNWHNNMFRLLFRCQIEWKITQSVMLSWYVQAQNKHRGGEKNASCESVSFFDRLSFWKSLNDRHYPLQLINEKDKKCNRIQLKVVIFYFFLITIHIIVDSLNPYFAFLLSSHTFLKDIQW